MAPDQSGTAPEVSIRSKILRTAETIVNADRNQDYGAPENNFQNIADLWLTRLIIRFRTLGIGLVALEHMDLVNILDPREIGVIDPRDVALYLSDVKDARIEQSPMKADHWVDRAGYTACGGDVAGVKL